MKNKKQTVKLLKGLNGGHTMGPIGGHQIVLLVLFPNIFILHDCIHTKSTVWNFTGADWALTEIPITSAIGENLGVTNVLNTTFREATFPEVKYTDISSIGSVEQGLREI